MLTWYDTFALRQNSEATESLFIGRNDVFSSSRVLQPSVLWSDTGVVQSSADRVRVHYLAFFRLKNVRPGAMEYAGLTFRQSSTMLIPVETWDNMSNGIILAANDQYYLPRLLRLQSSERSCQV